MNETDLKIPASFQQNIKLMQTEKSDTKELLESLDKTTTEFLRTVSSFNETTINTVPYEKSWTAAQVAEHVTKSNNGMVQTLNLTGSPAKRQVDLRVQELKNIFLNFEAKLQSPKFILPTQDTYEKETVIAGLRKSIIDIKEAADNSDLFETISHPIFGEITKLEIVHFVIYHTQRHIHQLENIFQKVPKN
jgi:hypothetical protein